MTGYETETKFQLSPRDFESLRGKGDTLEKEEQLNFYFDENWELSRFSATFRIRQFCRSDDSPVMTLKIPMPDDSSARTCLEVEKTLSNGHREILSNQSLSVDTDLSEEFSGPLCDLGVSRLELLDSMRTIRRHVRLFEDVVVEMDQVQFPGGERFFEVEFESDSPDEHRKAADLIQAHAPSAHSSEKSKYERFADILSGLHDGRRHSVA